MIASLHGTVVDIALGSAVIECGGVGYEFLATPITLASLVRGEEATILTSLIVREDAMTLYGFTSSSNKQMFHLLQTVSGLGPKLALAAQSVYDAQEIALAISRGDHKMLTAIPGVGKRMAERMVVDLKDKIAPWAQTETVQAHKTESAAISMDSADTNAVIEALVGLGFSSSVAHKTVLTIMKKDPSSAADSSTMLKAALAVLAQR